MEVSQLLVINGIVAIIMKYELLKYILDIKIQL